MKIFLITCQQIPRALSLVYRDRRYLFTAVGTGLLSALVLGRAFQLVTSVSGLGLFWCMTPLQFAQVSILAASIGLLIPMQVYVLMKRRERQMRAGTKEQRLVLKGWAAVRQNGMTVLGLVLGVVCLVCCAPLLIPAGLAFLGMSATAILSLTGSLVQWSGWLFLASLVLGWLTLLLVTHNVTAAGRLTPFTGKTERSVRERDIRGERRERAQAQEV